MHLTLFGAEILLGAVWVEHKEIGCLEIWVPLQRNCSKTIFFKFHLYLMILLKEGLKLGAPHCFPSSALIVFCRQTPSAPVLRLDSSGHIPGDTCQQLHQWNPDSGGTPGPEPLVGSQWLHSNCGLHPDSPDAQSGQVGASIQATLLTSEDTGVALIKPHPSQEKQPLFHRTLYICFY